LILNSMWISRSHWTWEKNNLNRCDRNAGTPT